MFKRIRQLHISLAAKCQLLFGTAVAAILFSALFVPFQRIEQLTEQLNERAAAAVADAVINDHVTRQRLIARSNPSDETAQLASRFMGSSTIPSTSPAAPPDDPANYPPPRLVPISAL